MVSWGDPVGSPTAAPLVLPSELLDVVRARVAGAAGERAAELTLRLLVNTATTTVDVGGQGVEPFVITGDIPAMWLRDSCLQLAGLLRLIPDFPELAEVVCGLLRRHWRMIRIDAYANAFNAEPNGNRWDHDLPEPGPWVWERKWELDSLTFPLDLAIRLHHLGHDAWQSHDFSPAVDTILDLAQTELEHDRLSPYRFTRPGAGDRDTLTRAGLGPATTACGLVFQGFRPSDDACELGFNVPGNAFFASTLTAVAPLLEASQAVRAQQLAAGIESALARHAILTDSDGERYLAYEVDGAGGALFLDDANLPSLLGLPYLGVLAPDDPLYVATRRKVLSSANPNFVTGSALRGVGSPHTPAGYVWPIAVAVAGLTALKREEKVAALERLAATTGGTGWMHEGDDANDPTRFTRPWFSWANAMFVELALDLTGFPRQQPTPRKL